MNKYLKCYTFFVVVAISLLFYSNAKEVEQNGRKSYSDLEVYELLKQAILPKVNFNKEKTTSAIEFIQHKIKDVCIQTEGNIIKVNVSNRAMNALANNYVSVEFSDISILELMLFVTRESKTDFHIREGTIAIDLRNP